MTTTAALRRPSELADAGVIAPHRLAELEKVAARYAVAVSPAMAALIDPGDPYDPIARQFVPDGSELDHRPGERADPIGDDAHQVAPGLVRRYPDRVLLKLVNVCAVYCRFCFRRESVGPGQPQAMSPAALDAALAWIAGEPEIWEVVITGGDPLVLSPRRLADVTRRLAAIPHVRVIRFHTRVPVVTPERIDLELVAALKAPGAATYVAIHANHPRELTAAAQAALARLADAGIPLIGQTVLLKGVNDDASVLEALMRGFVQNRVKPYYLHHGDMAPGTSHFRTTIPEGQSLMRALRGRVSGLCQPTYMLDIPGGHGKVPIGPDYLPDGPDGQIVAGIDGSRHAYPPLSDPAHES